MYTQCPECEVAFRVTADVLKQAAGKVRCGGCGVAFNALAHLSEEMPVTATSESPPAEAGTPPRSISAEQSAALLKTLDQLAGEDIRIEDTGVEWRVIDADEDEDLAEDPVPSMVHEEMRFDDNTPLPDDFDLDMPAVPPQPPEPVIETPPQPRLDESQVDLVFGEPDEWEDLLDDLDEAAAATADDAPETGEDIEVVEALPVVEDDADDDSDEETAELEIGASEAFAQIDLAAMDMDAQFARQAEELGLDMSGLHPAADDDTAADDAPAEELVLEAGPETLEFDEDETKDPADTSIEEDLIAAAFEVEAAAKAEAAKAEPEEIDLDGDAIELELDDAAADVEEIELEVAEPEHEPEPELESELESGLESELEPDEISLETDETDETEADASDAGTDDEINLDGVAPEELSRAGILDEDDYLEEITAEDEADVLDEIQLEDSPADRALAEAVLDEPAAEDISDEAPDETLLEAQELEDEAQLPDEKELAADLEMALEGIDDGDFAEPDDIEVPELTEEEKTVNMLIDQDLLAIAVEDEDGFTSTIVQKQVDTAADIAKEKPAADASDDGSQVDETAAADEDDASGSDEPDAIDLAAAALAAPADDDNPLMETIIMEGESVMTEEDQDRLEAARAAASESMKQMELEEEKPRFSLRDWQPSKRSMAAAAALLFVVLVIQVIHHSREALAVSPAFQSAIGPVYNLFGSPVTPAWNVSGWRFEATKGSTDDGNNVLTIYSRVGNNSEEALPYPLVHVELKDRFEEIIGSRVLEPAEYLEEGADIDRQVQPKETFNAVISIESPSAAATSFKLNVCYRIGGDRLRCDDKDFR